MSLPSRRQFLQRSASLGTGVLGMTGATLPGGALAAPLPDPLGASRFRACLQSPFAAQALSSGKALSLTLTAVNASPYAKADTAHEQAFTLVFDVASELGDQDTYEVMHPQLGRFAALMVPSADRRQLVAVFDRTV